MPCLALSCPALPCPVLGHLPASNQSNNNSSNNNIYLFTGKEKPPSSGLGLAAKSVQSGEQRDVALKVIPKKKVKGNENSVWGEMNVLRGLDHANIVRFFSPRLLRPF